MTPEGYRHFGDAYIDRRIPTINSLPDDPRAARKMLVAAIRASRVGSAHPPVAVRDLDLAGLGFIPTHLAIPMPWETPGATSWRSGKLHAHKANDVYLVHRDHTAPGVGLSALASLSHAMRDVVPAVEQRLFHPGKPLVLLPEKEKEAGALGGAAIGSVLSAGGLIAASPAMRAELLSKMRAFRRGRFTELGHEQRELPEEVRQEARAIAGRLQSSGFDPKKQSIGLGAAGGSGKSTLAKALAAELGMRHRNLDELAQDGGFGLYGFDLTKVLQRQPIKPGTVAEQTLLLNQIDPDTFGALVHLERPAERVRQNMLHRGRGAFQADYLDTAKEQQAIRHAFDATAGTTQSITPELRLKVKELNGFRAQDQLTEQAKRLGIDVKGLTREQLLNSLVGGKRTTDRGDAAFLRKGHIAKQLGILGLGGALGAIGGHLLSRVR